MCWVSNCRHITNSHILSRGWGGWESLIATSGNIVFPVLCFANSASILPAQGGLGDSVTGFQNGLSLPPKWFGWLLITPTKFPTSLHLDQQPMGVMVSQGDRCWLEGLCSHRARECIEGDQDVEWECLVLQQPQGDPGGCSKDSHVSSHGATTPALSVTCQNNYPHPSRFWNPPPLQETDTPSQSLASLKIRSVGPQQHWQVC